MNFRKRSLSTITNMNLVAFSIIISLFVIEFILAKWPSILPYDILKKLKK